MPWPSVSRVHQKAVSSLALFSGPKLQYLAEIEENVCHSGLLPFHRIVFLDVHYSCSDRRIGRIAVEPQEHLRGHLHQPDVAVDSGFDPGEERSFEWIADYYRKPPVDSLGTSGHQGPGMPHRKKDAGPGHIRSVRCMLEALLHIAPADISPHSHCRPLQQCDRTENCLFLCTRRYRVSRASRRSAQYGRCGDKGQGLQYLTGKVLYVLNISDQQNCGSFDCGVNLRRSTRSGKCSLFTSAKPLNDLLFALNTGRSTIESCTK